MWGELRYYAAASRDPAFFEDDVLAFEAADRASLPAGGGVVFVGSSSVRLWDTLAADMAPLSVVNRGFGGSQMSHLVHFARRIVLPQRPTAVVVYAGDNDLDASTGKTPEDVYEDFREFVAIVHAELPDTRIYFLAIKPSKLRWGRWPEMRSANERIADWTESDPRLAYLDVAAPLLGPDGRPRDDVFLFDGLHLNETGYAAWTAVVRPRLLADLRP